MLRLALVAVVLSAGCAEPARPPAAALPSRTPAPTSSPPATSPPATAEVRYPWQDLVVSADGRTLTVTLPYYGECDVFSRVTVDESLTDGGGHRLVTLETYKRRPAHPGPECARRTSAATVHSVRLREPLAGREVVQRSRPAPVPPGQTPNPSDETA